MKLERKEMTGFSCYRSSSLVHRKCLWVETYYFNFLIVYLYTHWRCFAGVLWHSWIDWKMNPVGKIQCQGKTHGVSQVVAWITMYKFLLLLFSKYFLHYTYCFTVNQTSNHSLGQLSLGHWGCPHILFSGATWDTEHATRLLILFNSLLGGGGVWGKRLTIIL